MVLKKFRHIISFINAVVKHRHFFDGLAFAMLLILIIVFRFLVLVKFSFQYTDSDQTIMWLGLKDYASGMFHEPRFYGQAYNSMIEALFAVPFYKMGIPAYKILPIITSIMALFPYVWITFFVFLKKSPKLSLIILAVPLLLPIEYSMITSLSRGFITGIFFSSLGCISLFYPKSKAAFLAGAFLAVIGYSLNSNAALISIPVVLYLFMDNVKNKNFYLYSSIGAFLGLLIHFSMNYFYVLHPFYDFHKMEIAYSFREIVASAGRLDKYFIDVTPIFYGIGYASLLMFLMIGFLLLRVKKIRAGILVAAIPLFIILTLGLDKVHDGSDSVFFSYSRMYLGIPVLLCISLSFFSRFIKSGFFYLFLLIPVAFFVFNARSLNKSVENNVSINKSHVVGIMKVSDLISECNTLKTVCDNYNIQLIVNLHNLNNFFYTYGCPCCNKEFPNTLLPELERRTWTMKEDEKICYQNILLIDSERDFALENNFIQKVPGHDDYFLILNNKWTTMDLLRTLGISFRPYKYSEFN